MKEFIFASNNPYKAEEIQAAIGSKLKIITLKQAGIDIDIPEPHDTLEANASEKSQTVYKITGKNCFSEDTGLEVEALNGEPGVKSARYAGPDKNFKKNIEKLLRNLGGNANRNARFRTVISLIFNSKEYLFEGTCEGVIGYYPKGEYGFGYDPIFTPANSNKMFGEMTLEEKSKFSHRKKASDKLVLFLQHEHIVP